MTYYLLDLFCGAGGASVGYSRAGFHVAGVDLEPQPRYPFGFTRGDALATLEYLLDRGEIPVFRNGRVDELVPLDIFDAIHASPPCQDYSATKHIHGGVTDYPRLIGPVRELLEQTGLPWVIENVELAKPEMRDPVMLCGSMFGNLGQWHSDTVYLQRHRLFEANFPLPQPACDHSVGVRAVTVAGHGRPDVDPVRGAYFAGRGYAALTREVMGIDWMTRDELNEAIPPTYSHFVGCQLASYLATMSTRTTEVA